MTAKDIINKGKVAVRQSSTLYPIYQNLFKEAFGYFPECPTCGSVNGHKHWDAFVAFGNGSDPDTLLTQNNITMSSKSFEIKNKNSIYSYNFKKKGQDRYFTSRTYGDVMSEAFAIAYLDNVATDEELLNQRKSEFSLLPSKYRDENEKNTVTDKTPITPIIDRGNKMPSFAELQQIAVDKNYPAEEWEKLRSKVDLSAYLEAKELDNSIDEDLDGGISDDDLI